VLGNQRLLALDIALKDTPARWWGEHKEKIKDWYQCKRLLAQKKEATNNISKMDKGHQQNTWRSAEHCGK
jgi:hypothetical protein